MRRFVFLSMLLALLVLAAAPAVAGPPAPPDGDNTNAKTKLCHYDAKTDGYLAVWLSEKGAQKHLDDGHGDGLPGDPVPGMDGYAFGDDCELTATEVIFAVAYTDTDPNDGPYNADDILIAKLVDGNGDGVPGPGDLVIMGQYPLDPDADPGDPADFGEWGIDSHKTDAAFLSNGSYFALHGDSFHLWTPDSPGSGFYAEVAYFGADPCLIRETFDPELVQVLQSSNCPSQPGTDASASVSDRPGDDPFIDVEIYVVP